MLSRGHTTGQRGIHGRVREATQVPLLLRLPIVEEPSQSGHLVNRLSGCGGWMRDTGEIHVEMEIHFLSPCHVKFLPYQI